MPTTVSDSALVTEELPGPDRYLRFYGLDSPPFRSGADPGRLWIGSAHRTILDALARAIRDAEGIAILTGDAGTGKTSLSHLLVTMLPPSISVGRVSSPGAAPADFFEAVLSAFGVRQPAPDKNSFATRIRDILAQATARGDKSLLIVDEAQGLSQEVLGEVSDLSATAAALEHPLVILLIGETRLTAALLDTRHAALRDRIIARSGVPPLGPDEVGDYVGHYLAAAGAVGEVFSSAAIRTIASLSRGAPGAINILGDRALLLGFARRARPISEVVVGECERTPGSPPAAHPGPLPRVASLPAAARGRRGLYVTVAATALLVTGVPALTWWVTAWPSKPARKASEDAGRPPDAPAREAAPPPAPAVVTLPSAGAPPGPATSDDAARATLPERRAQVSPTPIEAHAPGSARPASSAPPALVPRVTVPRQSPPMRDTPVREHPGIRETPAVRERPAIAENRTVGASSISQEVRPTAPVATRPPVQESAPPPPATRSEPASPGPREPQGRADPPDPSAIIDWLLKESSRR